jgi:hypothetical protein
MLHLAIIWFAQERVCGKLLDQSWKIRSRSELKPRIYPPPFLPKMRDLVWAVVLGTSPPQIAFVLLCCGAHGVISQIWAGTPGRGRAADWHGHTFLPSMIDLIKPEEESPSDVGKDA